MSLLLEIVTPEAKVFSEQVESVTLPTSTGDVQILPGHVPLLTALEPGELDVQRDNGTEQLAVDKGFAQIYGDTVAVITEQAINIEEIDLAAIEEAQNRAEAALKEAAEKNLDPAEIEKLEAVARFAVAQRLAKSKKR